MDRHCSITISHNKGMHADPKSRAAFGSGDAQRYAWEKSQMYLYEIIELDYQTQRQEI